MIFMPPRHGKSELASRSFPAWCLGRNPRRQIIAASYNQDLARDFGREVKNIVASADFQNVFPGVSLSEDSRASDRMNTNAGGVYVAAGVGTATTGRGAHIGLIDDPFKDREDADSETQRERVWRWYQSTFYTRLMPGAAVVLIQCMAGDTPVLMATGQEKPLRDIRPGDRVATYDNGKLAVSTVRNWVNNGPDRVFAIRMSSGTIVKANARHPFLVDKDGEPTWTQTKSLRPGHVIFRANGASGKARPAGTRDAANLSGVAAIVHRITTRSAGLTGFARRLSILGRGVRRICATATALALQSMSAFLPNRAGFALCANSLLPARTPAPIGTGSSASITATIARKFAGFSATIATLLLGTERRLKSSAPPLSTYEIAKDTVVEVVDAGVEDVFDVQIDRTENFIANGLVSHNTRWHEDDLAGRLLAGADKWEVLELPAIDVDGNALWPEWYDVPALERIRANVGPREWSALYQQRPQPDEGTFFQRAWLKEWSAFPKVQIYGTSDYAVTDGGGDYTVHRVWGIDADSNIYRLDGWRGQTAADEWIERKLDLIAKYKPLAWFGEGGVIQKAIEPMLRRRMQERRTYCRVEWLPSIHDKPTRARGIQARASMGKVFMEPGADVSEFLAFPAGKHDDEVDTASLMGRALDQAHPAIIVGQQQAKAAGDRWDRAMRRGSQEAGWKTI